MTTIFKNVNVTHVNQLNGSVKHIIRLDDKPGSFVQVCRDGEVFVHGKFSNTEIAAVIEALVAVSEVSA